MPVTFEDRGVVRTGKRRVVLEYGQFGPPDIEDPHRWGIRCLGLRSARDDGLSAKAPVHEVDRSGAGDRLREASARRRLVIRPNPPLNALPDQPRASRGVHVRRTAIPDGQDGSGQVTDMHEEAARFL
jgi:hypothetical protein